MSGYRYSKKAFYFLIVCVFVLGAGKAIASCDCHDCGECRTEYVRGHGSGSSGKWGEQDVPKRNWKCQSVEDLGSTSQKCEMCESNDIRYIHRMIHRFYDETLDVGCICAGYMDGTLGKAKKREKDLRNRATRRNNFTKRKWSTSKFGNEYLRFSGSQGKYMINMFSSKKKSPVFGAKVSKEEYSMKFHESYYKELTSLKWYKTSNEAKLAAFDYIFPSKVAFKEK